MAIARERLVRWCPRAVVFLVFAGCTMLVACDGGGGPTLGTGGTASPLASPTFPLDDAPVPGTFEVSAAFPSLGFSTPLFFAGVPGENRAVVVELGGVVQVFVDDAATQTTRVVLDLSAVIVSG